VAAFDVRFFIDTFLIALTGIPVTLILSVIPFLIAIPLGIGIAFLRLKKVIGASQLFAVYSSFALGTPLIIQIYLCYYVLPKALAEFVKFLGIGIDIYAIDPIFYALLVFTFNTTASMTETFRSALNAVDQGQHEAGLAVGLSGFRSFSRIVMPQVFLIALPNMATTAVNLMKGTSLAFVMAVHDVMAKARIEGIYSYKNIESYLGAFIIFFILCFVTERLFKLLESRLNAPWRKGNQAKGGEVEVAL
jgi:L-cystine transport system permease protein